MSEPSQDQTTELDPLSPFDPITGELKPYEERAAINRKALAEAKAAEERELRALVAQMIDERIDQRLTEIGLPTSGKEAINSFVKRIIDALADHGAFSPPAKS